MPNLLNLDQLALLRSLRPSRISPKALTHWRSFRDSKYRKREIAAEPFASPGDSTLAVFKDLIGILSTLRKRKLPAEPSSGDSTQDEDVYSKPLPVLPPEIWSTIISFVIRLHGRSSIHLEDHFLPPYTTETSPVDEPEQQLWQQDRATIPSVCRSWRYVASQIVPEYLRIHSIPQLRAIVEKFEDIQDGLPSLGEWVQRIDFKISESLTASPDLIPRLLKHTKRLMIYVNQNGSDYRPETQTPSSVLEALAEHCSSSLQRIEWSHVGEAPTWHDLANLCLHTPNLKTLRLTWIFSYTEPVRGTLELPSLETLYLGLIPDPTDTLIELPMSWDPLLNHFASNPESLPALRRFEIEIFPTDLHFFRVHGSKIRTFRTTNWSMPPKLPATLPLLTNLDSLVLTQSTEYVTLPPSHPTLRRICIAPFMENQVVVPPRYFSTAVLTPLESVMLSIDSTHLPRLEEVRLRNMGILMNLVDEPAWLLKWAKRWHFKGVKFCNMHGQSFSDTRDPENDPLLAIVRG
ncbi:hypothetical protein K438DRAFT_1973154 [Mycena galopus ATCC 62051]|nr:hypothetical protein K438DRAFT_1973154 [Mycena galopus ATCC 62051]